VTLIIPHESCLPLCEFRVSYNASRKPLRRALGVSISAAAIAFFGACQDAVTFTEPRANPALPASEVRDVPPPALTSLRPSAPAISSTCGAGVTYKLSDGIRTPGTVIINNDASNLYITYSATSQHWWISDTRLAASKDPNAIPRDENGAPAPWSFTEAGQHEPPLTSITHQLSLASLGASAGQTVYVAAMAGLVHPRDESNYEGAWDWMVMWGLADVAQPANVVNAYVINACAPKEDLPPQTPGAAALITITFDDGWKTTITNAYPVLRDLGLKGNLAINSQPIDEHWSSYMTLADLNTLWAAGWKIVNHSVSHADLTTLGIAAMEREIRDNKAWLEAHGFGPTDVFIVPFHSWGQRERDMILKYHTRVRGYTIDQFSPEKYVKMPFAEPADLTAFEPEYAPFTTQAGRDLTLKKIDYAVKNGMFLDLLFHKVTTQQVPAFKLLMSDIAARYKANIGTW
jgi:peptidoglycan/xylan/chitin deacetylase (PgdA/CDA1 family)